MTCRQDVNLIGSWYRDSQLFPDWWNVGFHLVIFGTVNLYFAKNMAIQNENTNLSKNSSASRRSSETTLQLRCQIVPKRRGPLGPLKMVIVKSKGNLRLFQGNLGWWNTIIWHVPEPILGKVRQELLLVGTGSPTAYFEMWSQTEGGTAFCCCCCICCLSKCLKGLMKESPEERSFSKETADECFQSQCTGGLWAIWPFLICGDQHAVFSLSWQNQVTFQHTVLKCGEKHPGQKRGDFGEIGKTSPVWQCLEPWSARPWLTTCKSSSWIRVITCHH